MIYINCDRTKNVDVDMQSSLYMCGLKYGIIYLIEDLRRWILEYDQFPRLSAKKDHSDAFPWIIEFSRILLYISHDIYPGVITRHSEETIY